MRTLKIVVIGGGSSYTPELIEGIILRRSELPLTELVLVDVAEGSEKLKTIEALTQRMFQKAQMPVKVTATLNRRQALAGADFVLTQLRVGGLKARALDEKIPLVHGVIGQETTGPGGLFKALRTIPVLKAICADIEAICPQAFLINFTNPAGLITEMIKKETNVKVIGLCNVPIGMRNNIAKVLECDPRELEIDFVGLNHLVWATQIRRSGENVMPEIIDALAKGASMTMKNISDLEWDETFLRATQKIPCPYHRYYYMKKQMLEDELAHADETRAEAVMAIEKTLFEKYKEVSLNVKPKELENRGGAYYSDAAISLISAIYNDKNEMHVVNVQNGHTLPFLPQDAVIEVNAIVGKEGAIPLKAGHYSQEMIGLMTLVKAYEQLAIEAGLTGDYDKAYRALSIHPLVDSLAQAKAILDDMLLAHQDYLPQFKN